MKQNETVKRELPICKKCGDPVPPGKEYCWCCEHGPKLHKDVDIRSSK